MTSESVQKSWRGPPSLAARQVSPDQPRLGTAPRLASPRLHFLDHRGGSRQNKRCRGEEEAAAAVAMPASSSRPTRAMAVAAIGGGPPLPPGAGGHYSPFCCSFRYPCSASVRCSPITFVVDRCRRRRRHRARDERTYSTTRRRPGTYGRCTSESPK
jgi:hypothetical protein